jgi:hypothetical protein
MYEFLFKNKGKYLTDKMVNTIKIINTINPYFKKTLSFKEIQLYKLQHFGKIPLSDSSDKLFNVQEDIIIDEEIFSARLKNIICHNASCDQNIGQQKKLYLDKAKKVKTSDTLTRQITKIFDDLIDDALLFESCLISDQLGVTCASLDKFIEHYDKTKNDTNTKLAFNQYVSIFPEYKNLKTLSADDSQENKSQLIKIVRENAGSYINKLSSDELLSACIQNQNFYKNICLFKQYYLSPKVKKTITDVLLQYKQVMNDVVTKILVTQVNELKTDLNELKDENQELKTKFNKYESILEQLFVKYNTNSIDDNSVELSGSQGGGEGEE